MSRSLVEETPTPSACATMAGAITDLARRGFTADLRAVDGALRAGSGETLWPRDLTIREVHRFEGVSDPDDTEILYAIESVSGVRGTLADAFGVYADPVTGAALRDVPIRRGKGDQP
jgi:hypothetical protein